MSRKLSPELYSAPRKCFAQQSPTLRPLPLPDSVAAFVRAARAAQKTAAPGVIPPSG